MLLGKSAMGSATEPPGFLRSGKASLALEKFNLFWTDGPSLGFYVLELLKYYCETEKAKKASGMSVESTISALYFLVLSNCYDPSDHDFQNNFEAAKNYWGQHRSDHHSFSPLLDEIIITVLNLSASPDDYIHFVFSHSLLLHPRIESFADITYTNYLDQQIKISTPQDIRNFASKGFLYLSSNPRFCLLDKGEFILSYHYVKNYLAGLGYLPVTILDLFHRKVQDIIISLRANDCKFAQRSLLPLLHMLEVFLTRFPIISYDSMDALIIDLDIIRRWPIPYGSAANRLLEVVIKELKAPGSAIRYKLREELPVIDQHVGVFEKATLFQGVAKAVVVVDALESLEVSFFYKICSANQRYRREKLVEIIEKIVSRQPINVAAVYAHIKRCLIVLFSFSLYVEITITDLSHIAGLSTESIFGLYTRILQMADKIEAEEIDKARSVQG
jgi:hypothetical protein